jgi:ADP-heptose:LPS heptosyltransferase
MALPTHILVIRLSALGDVAMMVPVIRVLMANYPDLKVTVVSRIQFKPIFDVMPEVRFLEADVYGKHKGLGLLKLAKEAKSAGIDAVADMHNVIRSRIIRTSLKLKGIQNAFIDKGRAEKKFLTAGNRKELPHVKSTHERYADVFRQLGFSIDLADHSFPKRMDVSPRIQHFFGNEPKKAIGIAPFAAYASKMYPLEMIKEVIGELDQSNLCKVFLLGGGPDETEILKAIEAEFKNVVNVADQLTFQEELSLICNLDLMVAMDSSNGHLAAMFGVPVITLWGVTHPCLGFKPFNQPDTNQLLCDREKFPLIPTSVYGNSYPTGYENAMESIPVTSVMKKINNFL